MPSRQSFQKQGLSWPPSPCPTQATWSPTGPANTLQHGRLLRSVHNTLHTLPTFKVTRQSDSTQSVNEQCLPETLPAATTSGPAPPAVLPYTPTRPTQVRRPSGSQEEASDLRGEREPWTWRGVTLHNLSHTRGPPLLYPDVHKERRAAKKAAWGQVRRDESQLWNPKTRWAGAGHGFQRAFWKQRLEERCTSMFLADDSRQPRVERPEGPCTDEQNMVLPYNGVSINLKKEGHPNTCHNTNNLADIRRSERSQTQEDSKSPQL